MDMANVNESVNK